MLGTSLLNIYNIKQGLAVSNLIFQISTVEE
jgi:hypothetical protein